MLKNPLYALEFPASTFAPLEILRARPRHVNLRVARISGAAHAWFAGLNGGHVVGFECASS
jgi:hypothetical protein